MERYQRCAHVCSAQTTGPRAGGGQLVASGAGLHASAQYPAPTEFPETLAEQRARHPRHAPMQIVKARSAAQQFAQDQRGRQCRIWAGFHDRTSTRVGTQMGREVGQYLASHFAPTNRDLLMSGAGVCVTPAPDCVGWQRPGILPYIILGRRAFPSSTS